MTQKEWMKEGTDGKLVFLLFLNKIGWIIFLALIGALLSGGIYFLTHVVYGPAKEYEAVSKLYLEFAKDDDGEAYQYYNGYTWNDLMTTDPILNYTMTLLPDMDKETVKKAVSADILSDIRVLTVTVRTHDAAETNKIVQATEKSLIHFAKGMKEFDKIWVMTPGKAELVVVEPDTIRVTAAGAVGGFLLAVFLFLLQCILDDSVYVPSAFEKRYGVPVFGVRFASGKETPELEKNYTYLNAANRKYIELPVRKDLGEELVDYEELRKVSGVILTIPFGAKNAKLVEREMAILKTQGCNLLGAVITNADDKFYKYYFRCAKKSQRLNTIV